VIFSESVGVCKECLLERFDELWSDVQKRHADSRIGFGYPGSVPRDVDGVVCRFCVNECSISAGSVGFCGVRKNEGGRLVGGVRRGYLRYYFDPLPTNCVAEFCCSASREGFSRYRREAFNLAVFYTACNFNCAFCQNWHYREDLRRLAPMSPADLASAVNERTYCICYFGGDPSCQMPHSILAAREALSLKPDIRICWETNGSMNPKLLESALKIALESGGCVKFDIKAYDERLHLALCGTSNRRTLENFELAASWFTRRKEPPLVVASTPLISGYVDADEVGKIAGFIASLDCDIPYSLLAFHPDFRMTDLPVTPRDVAFDCYEAAKSAGLKRVHLGNIHLL